MNVTLHLTDQCNLACRYCYVCQGENRMSSEVALAALKMAAHDTERAGIAFFGGEPLLCKDRICEVVEEAERMELEDGCRFHFKMTTNGTLLDDDFLEYMGQKNIFIALSHDGVRIAHDKNRIYPDGKGSFGQLENLTQKLLQRQPYTPAMMTIAPNTVEYYAEGVEYLYNLGFRYLICSMDYSGNWTEKELDVLQMQYRKLAKWYYALSMREKKFYFSPFEVKISSHIHQGRYKQERCELGIRQVSVAPDGRIYPCVQFVGDNDYCIGDVFSGIDEAKRQKLYQINEEEPESCRECALRMRCNHHCGCLNRQVTGSLREVAPSLCAHERIVLPIADRLAEALYKKRSALFIQKQYNDLFPVLSLLEDKLNQ